MSAGAARRLRWQHRAACSLLFFFVVILLPLLIPMTQGGHQEPVHVGEHPHTQLPPVDGGEHAKEEDEEQQQQQQLSRLGLGSRPPCCNRKCGECAACKLVEVRDGANYEIVWWKCRCGGALFGP